MVRFCTESPISAVLVILLSALLLFPATAAAKVHAVHLDTAGNDAANGSDW